MKNSNSSKLRIGVLPPASNFVPFLAADLLAALQFGFAESGVPVELIPEFAGHNAEPKLLLPKVQHLLLLQRVAAVVAPLNVALIDKLSGTFQNQATPLVVLSMGEDPLFEGARNPFVFVNSFQLWRAAWMSGYLGARRFGPRAGALVSLHEGGYGLAFAFQLGLEAANGSLLQTAVTHTQSSSEDPSSAIASIVAREPDFIWAAYSGKEAASFFTACGAAAFRPKIPVLGLPPLVDEHVRKSAGDSVLGTYFMAPHPPRAEAPGAVAALAKAIGRPPHPYALLAYESAHLIASAARAVETPDSFLSDFPRLLRQAEFRGPRGLIRFDNGAELESPVCLRQVNAGSDSVEEIEPPPLLNEQSALARRNLAKQGWVNPYLCG
jgi:ABC-type branched-subunit amino acid transport system substrate-binding protein